MGRVDLSTVDFTPELLARVPRNLVLKCRVLTVSCVAGHLRIAVADPPDIDIIDSLCHLLRRDLEFRVADTQQLEAFIERLFGHGADGDPSRTPEPPGW